MHREICPHSRTQTLQPGESITFSEPVTDTVTVSVEVTGDVPDGATFSLDHSFTGLGGSRSVTTGPTTVLVDPAVPEFSIVNSNFDDAVGANRLLEFGPDIENTGDLTQTSDVTFIIELTVQGEPLRASFPIPTTLSGGEQTTVGFPLQFGSFSRQTGTQIIETDVDRAEGQFQYQAAAHRIQNLSAPDSQSSSQLLDVSIELSNVGELEQLRSLQLLLAGEELAEPIQLSLRNVAIPPGGSDTITISNQLNGIIPSEYTLVAVGIDNTGQPETQAQAAVTITDPVAPAVVGDSPATDPDGDGLYEDVNGDGSVNFADLQTMFANRDQPVVQNNAEVFNFNGEGGITFGDLQALFSEINNDS